MPLKIRFVSDYVCPYCLAAKIPLLEAAAGRDVEIQWLPFELTREPEERIDTYHDQERREKWAESLGPIVEKLGLDMKLPPKVIPRPYTRLAFEGYHFAREQGKGEEYNDRMYQAYFSEELDIGDLQVLVELAGKMGLDQRAFEKALKSGAYREIQEKEDAYSKNVLKVESVPTIFIGETRINGGVYDREEFKRLIEMAEKQEEESFVTGMSCGIHGCN